MARVGAFRVVSRVGLRVGVVGLIVVGLAALGVAAAQDDKVPTLHAYTNLVQIPVLVLDHDNKQLPLIAPQRFFVSLDGGPRFRVTHVRLEGADPITLAILLDVSQPYPGLMRTIDDALGGLAPGSLHAKDHVSMYSMDCHLRRSADDLPADSAALKAAAAMALKPWRTQGREKRKDCQPPWNLWDALSSITQTFEDRPGRRVILVVTDGIDRGSKNKWTELREYAQQRGVAIFGLVQPLDRVVNFLNGSGSAANIANFNTLCGLTGGTVLAATDKDLAERLKEFIAMLRGRYIVEFPHPMSTTGGDHDMAITIEKMDAYIAPSGIGIPVDDPAVLNDPNSLLPDPTHAPALGKKRPAPPR
jgi:hypothetical protein